MTYYREPSEITGYSIDAENSFWQICIPQETRNLVFDPSFESNSPLLSGTVVQGGMIGFYCAQSVPNVGNTVHRIYVQFTTESAGTYTISAHVKKENSGNNTFSINLYNDAVTKQISSRTFIISQKSKWIRISNTISNLQAATTYTIVLFCQGDVTFQADCLQAENLPFATTYVDGDMEVYLKDSTNSYYWDGLPYKSASVRKDTTRTGGRLISLEDVGFRTISVGGLGVNTIERTVSRSVSGENTVSSFFSGVRNISINGVIYGKTFEELNQKRKELINLFNPFSFGTNDNPVLMRVQLDDNSDPFDILVRYVNGLEGEITNRHQQSFQISLSAIENSYLLGAYKSAVLPVSTTHTNVQALTKNLETGEWKTYNYQTPSGGTRGEIRSIFLAPNKDIYVCGNMSHIVHKLKVVTAGESTTVTPSTTRIGNLEFQSSTNLVGAKKIAGTYINGELYLAVAGDFKISTTDCRVAIWRESVPNTWTSIVANIPSGTTINDIAFYENRLFIAGKNIIANNSPTLVEYNISTSSFVNQSTNNIVFSDTDEITALYVHTDQKLYFAGSWTKSIIGGSDRLGFYDLITTEFGSVLPVLSPLANNGPFYPLGTGIYQIFIDKNDQLYFTDRLSPALLNIMFLYGAGKNAPSISFSGYAETGNSDWSYNSIDIASTSTNNQISGFAVDKYNHIYFAGPLQGRDTVNTKVYAPYRRRVLSRLWSRDGFLQESPLDTFHFNTLVNTTQDNYEIAINNNIIALSTNMEGRSLVISNAIKIENTSNYPCEIVLMLSGTSYFVGLWNWTTKEQLLLSSPLVIPNTNDKTLVFFDKTQFLYRNLNNEFWFSQNKANTNYLLPINITGTTPNALVLKPGTNWLTIHYQGSSSLAHRIFWREQLGHI